MTDWQPTGDDREHKFVVGEAVVEFFAGRTKREREDLLRALRAWLLRRTKKENGSKGQAPVGDCR